MPIVTVVKIPVFQVLLDLTGVPFIATTLAAYLMRSARAAQLTGSGVTIVGISPRAYQDALRAGR